MPDDMSLYGICQARAPRNIRPLTDSAMSDDLSIDCIRVNTLHNLVMARLH